MKICVSVKRALCVSLLWSATSAFAYAPFAKFDCGMYRVHGRLKLNAQGQFVLSIQENSPSQYELILLGGSFEEKMRFVGSEITAEVYVPKKIEDNTKPLSLFQRWVKKSSDDVVVKTAELPCDQHHRFKR